MSDDREVARRVLAGIDLTSLNDARDDDVAALCAKAAAPEGAVAAVCSWPDKVAEMAAALPSRPPWIAAVVNFPTGGTDAPAAVAEAEAVIAAGADELDLVWPYVAWLAGERETALAVVTAVRAVAPDRRLKVILETGAFADDETAIAEAGRALIEAGADFLKTSTGKSATGATLPAARALLGAIHESGRPVAFKASGGIRTLAEAASYLALVDEIMGPDWAGPATFRIGASRLLDDVLATLRGEVATAGAETGY